MKRFEVSPFRQVLPFAIFEDLDKNFWPSLKKEAGELFPKLELGEREGVFYASLDIPGVNKDNINIDVNDDVVIVSGERKEERKAEHYSERVYGSFQRSFRVPKGYDLEKVEAHFDNGVLNLAIPQKEEIKNSGRKIEIKSEKEGLFNKIL